MKNKIFNHCFYVTTTKFQCGYNMTCSQCSLPLSPGMWTDELITPKSVKNPRLIYDIFCNFLHDQQFYHFHCKNHSSQPFIVVRQKGFNPTTKQDNSRMDQVKLVEDSPCPLKFFKGCLAQFLLRQFLNTFSQMKYQLNFK